MNCTANETHICFGKVWIKAEKYHVWTWFRRYEAFLGEAATAGARSIPVSLVLPVVLVLVFVVVIRTLSAIVVCI